MNTFLKLLLSGLLFSAGLNAQENQTIQTSFRVIPVLSANWKGIFYRPYANDQLEELKFQSLRRSFKSYDYKGPNPLFFYREDGLDDAGERKYKVVGQIDVISSELVLFFAPNSASSGDSEAQEFRVIGIDDSPSSLPADHICFINLTGTQLGCRFMDDNFTVKNGLNSPISIKDSFGGDVFVGMVVQNENSHRVVLKNNWRFSEGNRHVVLLLPPKKRGSFRIRAYRITEFVGENPRFN